MDAPLIDISRTTIAAIVARHRLGTHSYTPLRSSGRATSVYLLDDRLVLRVPRDHPALIAGLSADPIVIPAARAAGVRTPRLLAFDDSRDLLPVPYAVYERVHGAPLSALALDPETTPLLWRELGGDLARLHTGVAADGAMAQLSTHTTDLDPQPWLDDLHGRDLLADDDQRWLRAWLRALEPFARVPVPPRLCHGDVNTSNIMADPTTHTYLGLIDWGGAGWGDPSWDFVPVPLRAVPLMLAGYRAVAPLHTDAMAEARILWHHLQFAIYGLHGGAWEQADVARRLQRLRYAVGRFVARPETRWMAELVPGV